MMPNPKLIIDIITKANTKALDQAEGKVSGFNSAMGKMVGPAAAVLGGITALGVVALQSASDLQQAAGGTEAVFGDSAKQIEQWAASAAESVGLSSAAYQTGAAKIGSQLKNLGVPMDQVAGKTDEMIRLGADLAATYGGTTEEAVSALGAAFRGEADPAERYGLALNQTAVNAELAARGQSELEGSALSAAKAQIIMEKATEQAGGAVGAFGRENDTLAHQQQVLSAKIEDTGAALGTALLPIITPVVAALSQMATWIQENTTLFGIIIGVIAALAAIILIYAAAQWVANSAMFASPVFWIIAAIVALIAIIVVLVVWIANNTEAIAQFFTDMWESIKAVTSTVVQWFQAVWGAVAGWFQGVWSAVAGFFRSLWASMVGIVNSVVSSIRGVIGSVASWFKSVWDSAVKFVQDVIRNLGSVFDTVFSAIGDAINGVVGFFQNIISAIQDVISWIGRIKIPDIGGMLGGLLPFAATASVSGNSVPVVSGTALAAVPSRVASGAGGGGGTVININAGLESADAIARRVRSVLGARERREGGVRITRATR